MAARKRTAVFVSGGGSNLQALLDAAAHPEFPAEIVLVLSNKADAYGLERAKKAGVPTVVLSHKDYANREAFDDAMHEVLVAQGIELVCLAGFMRLLTPDFVNRWHGRMINIHPSLLPSFKGLHTHERAIAEGVRFAGCTVHFVVAEMDAGPIIIQAAVPILSDDTSDVLAARVLQSEHQIYPQALRWLAADALVVEGQRVRVIGGTQPSQALINPQPQ
jgi:phosphoribosylglycinamide formyltransferase-1